MRLGVWGGGGIISLILLKHEPWNRDSGTVPKFYWEQLVKVFFLCGNYTKGTSLYTFSVAAKVCEVSVISPIL
jgi:hypothetical protein